MIFREFDHAFSPRSYPCFHIRLAINIASFLLQIEEMPPSIWGKLYASHYRQTAFTYTDFENVTTSSIQNSRHNSLNTNEAVTNDFLRITQFLWGARIRTEIPA